MSTRQTPTLEDLRQFIRATMRDVTRLAVARAEDAKRYGRPDCAAALVEACARLRAIVAEFDASLIGPRADRAWAEALQPTLLTELGQIKALIGRVKAELTDASPQA